MKVSLCLFALLWAATTPLASAGSATWGPNPASGDWNTAPNWNPTTVPNAQTDVASFVSSSVTQLSLSSSVSLDSMVFNPGADSFALTAAAGRVFSFYGDGVVNNSGQMQSFDLVDGGIDFYDSSSAGEAITYTLSGTSGIYFSETTAAGNANFVVEGGDAIPPTVFFSGTSLGTPTAENATFTVLKGGRVFFQGATAGNATINAVGGTVVFFSDGNGGQSIIDCSEGGSVVFGPFVESVGTGQLTAHGATGRKGLPGMIEVDSYLPSAATYVIEGGTGSQSPGGLMVVAFDGTLSDGNVTVTGGKNGGLGGSLIFRGKSTGANARVSLSGNSVMDFSRHDLKFGSVTVGSIEGKGSVILGGIPLLVGANGLSTTFSGAIKDGDARPMTGPLTKIGGGTFILSGASTYASGTTISAGALSVMNLSGSATGTGPVTVDRGTLGGTGAIGGAVTVAAGVLWPSVALSDPATLTIESSLTFNSGSTYTCRLNTKKRQSDSVTASGVTIASNAQFNLMSVVTNQLPAGKIFVVINNVGTNAINGVFANLAEGATINAGQNILQASYTGGDGNDLALTIVPK